MEKRNTQVREVILLDRGKWGIVVDFVLQEKELVGKDLRINYEEIEHLDESRDGYLMIETLEAPMIRRGDTIEITVRDRSRKKRRG